MSHPAAVFVGALFEPNDWLELRLILRRGAPGIQHWIKAADIEAWIDELTRRNEQGYNCYFGANPRTDTGGGADEDVALARCLFVDFDDGCSPALAGQKIREAELPDPSILVHSGGGAHAYWLLEEPVTDMAQWTAAQRGLIATLGSDPVIHNPSRVMRLPGFANRKPGRDGVVAAIALMEPGRCWPFAEFPLAELPTPRAAVPVPANANMDAEARRALRRMDGIKRQDGADGSRRLITCACIAVEHGLDDASAIETIRSVKTPFPTDWTDAEILARLRDAEGKATRGAAVSPAGAPPARISAPNQQHPSTPARNLTDLGNAERLIDAHGADLHYMKALDRWLVWDGLRWCADDVGMVQRFMAGVVRNIYAEARHEDDADRRKAIVKHAAACESNGRIEAAIALARWQPGIAITPDDLDRHPNLINTQSGTFDVLNGEVRDAARADLCTHITAAGYNPDAECPRLDSLLAMIFAGHLDVADYLQRAIGYCATGYIREQVLFMAHGSGRNGKTTAFDAIMATLGDYAIKGAPDLISLRRTDEHPTNVAVLQGRRMVILSEVDDTMRWNEARMKELTGETRLTARVMRGDPFQFDATHKLVIFGNSKPQIRGTDLGTWRRIRLVPFEHTIPEDQVDPEYPAKLAEEQEGILRWILQGASRWRASGLGPPAEVLAATEEYRTESDNISRFIADRCEVGGFGQSTGASTLHKAYIEWCEDTGEVPKSQNRFGKYLRTLGLPQDKDPQTRRKMWVGIELK